MTEEGRTSRRARKQVNYSQFNADDDDFDDDFADMTPPPGKKAKVEKELKPKKLKKERKPKKERKTADEETYERELEIVLELSKHDKSENGDHENDEAMEKPSLSREKETEMKEGSGETDEEMPVLERVKMQSPVKSASPRKKRTPKKQPKEDPDKIEILEEDVQENGGRKRRRAATKAVAKYVDSEDEEDKNEKEEGDDFKAEVSDEVSEPEDDSAEEDVLEDDDDGDSDFEGHWSKAKKKGRGRGKAKSPRGGGRGNAVTANKIKPRISATVQPVNKGRGGGGGVGSGGGGSVRPGSLPRMRDHHSPVPSRASPGGSLIIRKPNWVPPGRAGETRSEGAGIKSPGGGLRLGLSKKSRVKPLHSSVKVP